MSFTLTVATFESLQLQVEFSSSEVYSVTSSAIFINDLEEEMQCMLIKSVDSTKLGETAYTLKVRVDFQRHAGKLEEWANRNLRKFSENICEVLNWGWTNSLWWNRLRSD